MQLDDHNYEYTVTDHHKMRSNIRRMEERAYSGAGNEYTVTLYNHAKSKQVKIDLVKEGDVVKFTLLGKDVYTKQEVYELVKDELELH